MPGSSQASMGCVLYAVRSWKRDILVTDAEELITRKSRSRSLCVKRIDAKEVLGVRERDILFVFEVILN